MSDKQDEDTQLNIQDDDTAIPDPVVKESEEVEQDVTTEEGDQIAADALADTAGREAIEAEEMQSGTLPPTDESLTGEPFAETKIDERDVVTQDLQEEVDPKEAVPDSDVSIEEVEESGVVESDTPPAPMSKKVEGARWYVVHTYSGHENKVHNNLLQKIDTEHLEDNILDILVPTQDKIEIRGGKKESVKEKIFPGYILVYMVLDDTSWLAVRTTPGVTSFVGASNKPTPIPDSEVASIVKFMTQGAAPTFKDVYMVDDTVKITEGPFAQFIGKVESVDKDRGKVKVLVSIFGRETPVELDFLQVQKL